MKWDHYQNYGRQAHYKKKNPIKLFLNFSKHLCFIFDFLMKTHTYECFVCKFIMTSPITDKRTLTICVFVCFTASFAKLYALKFLRLYEYIIKTLGNAREFLWLKKIIIITMCVISRINRFPTRVGLEE